MDMNQTLITIGTTIATTLAAKGIEAPGKTLGNLWDIAIGNKVAAAYEKSKIKHTLDVEDFKNELINNISSIQKENLQDPKISIVGPALEASKYYFDEKEIRDMFANLIASSIDSTYNGIVQHSFVEIIKQLSPYDAKLFSKLDDKEAIVDIRIENEAAEGYTIFKNLFLTPLFLNYDKNLISIDNLERLGLIKVQEDRWLIDNQHYDIFYNNPPYSQIKNESFSFKNMPAEIIVKHKFLYLTSLGKAFKKVCIKDSL